MLALMQATVRTNYYHENPQALVLKIACHAVPHIPLPVPKIETFVFGHQVVGTHLRMDAVARGGIRASDRASDYRSEVLHLCDAQQKKNAIIVPSGAKGGFVARRGCAGVCAATALNGQGMLPHLH